MKKKALFICSRVPYPAYSGAQIRMMNNLRIIAERFEVDLLCYGAGKLSEEAMQGISRYANKVQYFKVGYLGFLLNLMIGFLLNTKPFQVNLYTFPRIVRWVRENQADYDLIFCMHIRTAEYVRGLESKKIAIDFVDSISLNYENLKGVVKGPLALLYRMEQLRVQRYELACTRSFGIKIITSERDRMSLVNAGANDITVIPHFLTDIDKSSFNSSMTNHFSHVDSPFILFIGKMNYEPNVSAAVFFCNRIFKRLRCSFPNVRFLIVGNHPSKTVRALSRIPGVEVTGFVPSIDPFLQACELLVAPMVSGSGVQTKVLEAFRMGKCVVATSQGAIGLNWLTGREIKVADSENDLITAISHLLSEEGKFEREEMGRSAREYFTRYYSYGIVRDAMLNCFYFIEN